MSTDTVIKNLTIHTAGETAYPRIHLGARDLQRNGDQPADSPSYTRFEVTPAGPTIGAYIEGVDLADIDDELHAELHRALLEFKVLFFRDQSLTGPQHISLARRWGSVEVNDFFPNGEAQEISRLAKGDMSVGTENVWHSDTSFRKDPSMASILRAVEVPPVGGNTVWADMAAAYDNLPEPVKEKIEGLRAIHTFTKSWGLAMSAEQVEAMSKIHPPIAHPIVRTHPETGRRLLYVNEPFTSEIVGLPKGDGDQLLDYLMFQARTPEYQIRFQWEPNSVAIWDNRSTQHYAVNDYFPHRRVMERVTVAGDLPR
ncbi:TauD/TfdA dioxygenase family protein [Gordonia neofelifaecis]|uniref:Taurine dioxygenase n=1 Tax=Gordonia neofelifaecis NRRL B-59395 TaxID=644548 RepID=F1YP99_9ACTN|nr:TauD/TfdA family dioxygenase [Gordonia neofelifaecis]EGD53494.1 taurine dioxygenase [Gordonia neofelifaecis NRRL B-59395]